MKTPEIFTCRRLHGAEAPKTCGRPHKTASAALSCAKGTGPGLTVTTRAEVWQAGVLLRCVVSYEKNSIRGRSISCMARWAEIPVVEGQADEARIAALAGPGLAAILLENARAEAKQRTAQGRPGASPGEVSP